MTRLTEGLVGYEELIEHHKEHHRLESLGAQGAQVAPYSVAHPKELVIGEFYWIRHKVERHWRPCYVFQDPDGNVWIEILGQLPFTPTPEGITHFEFANLNRPAV